MIDFVGKKKIFFSVSILLLIASIVVSFFPGVKLDIQFRGGAILTYEYEGELSKEDVQKPLSQNTSERLSVQVSTDVNTQKKNLVVSITSGESLTEDEAAAITKSLQDAYKDNDIKSVGTSNVDPTMGREFFAKCLVAVAFAALLMIVYIGFRFRKIGGWSAGCMAVVALLHDAMIVYAVNVIFGFSISDSFMAVVLTIIGYSINSTIVVYDRVRENKRLYGRKLSTAELVNKSINQS
ncbi:protein translocase subunit SecF, partial [Akkermansia muciniphila]|uniref:protein translocase subunit SecF n=1 Tax=Akkermansia muciniphila TaxID=239935 RepID=UPI00122ED7CF